MYIRIASAGGEMAKPRNDEIARDGLLDPAGAPPDHDQPLVQRKPKRAVNGLRVSLFDFRALLRRA
jgi:hypothetical protein